MSKFDSENLLECVVVDDTLPPAFGRWSVETARDEAEGIELFVEILNIEHNPQIRLRTTVNDKVAEDIHSLTSQNLGVYAVRYGFVEDNWKNVVAKVNALLEDARGQVNHPLALVDFLTPHKLTRVFASMRDELRALGGEVEKYEGTPKKENILILASDLDVSRFALPVLFYETRGDPRRIEAIRQASKVSPVSDSSGGIQVAVDSAPQNLFLGFADNERAPTCWYLGLEFKGGEADDFILSAAPWNDTAGIVELAKSMLDLETLLVLATLIDPGAIQKHKERYEFELALQEHPKFNKKSIVEIIETMNSLNSGDIDSGLTSYNVTIFNGEIVSLVITPPYDLFTSRGTRPSWIIKLFNKIKLFFSESALRTEIEAVAGAQPVMSFYNEPENAVYLPWVRNVMRSIEGTGLRFTNYRCGDEPREDCTLAVSALPDSILNLLPPSRLTLDFRFIDKKKLEIKDSLSLAHHGLATKFAIPLV